jgi:molybdopterin-guanine dinucleotide biosynthesis protein A
MKSVAIQAGGESRRMGHDKALMPFLDTTLIERVINRVAPLGDEVLITTNHPQQYLVFNLPLYPDILPGKGALGGLYTALKVAKHPIVIVVACDMPFVNADILNAAVSRLHFEEADVAIPKTGKGFEPFHAAYRRETCLPAVDTALRAGEKRLISWFTVVKVAPMPESELLRYDPQLYAFNNLNTRQDFREAEALARDLAR